MEIVSFRSCVARRDARSLNTGPSAAAAASLRVCPRFLVWLLVLNSFFFFFFFFIFSSALSCTWLSSWLLALCFPAPAALLRACALGFWLLSWLLVFARFALSSLHLMLNLSLNLSLRFSPIYR